MSNKITSEEFDQLVNEWLERLSIHIGDIVNQKRTPILIALSRKMPRFIDWVKTSGRYEKAICLNEFEITTELALPFILCGKNSDSLEFIIVDDIIIHGSTLRNVSNCLYYITKRKPRVSCIVLHENAAIPDSVTVQDILEMEHLSQGEVDSFVKFVANIVEKHQLPLDLEFPIFRTKSDIPNSEIEKKWSELTKIVETNSCTSYQIGGLEGDRICIVPNTSNFNIYVPDFTKFRFYKKKANTGITSIMLEVFAPTILNEFMLTATNQDLFTADKYNELWNNTTLDIRRKITELRKESSPECFDVTVNYTRSLCVWANYILSFSYYKFLKSNLDSEQNLNNLLEGYKISLENLRLVLGNEIAISVLETLESILDSSDDMNVVQQVSGKVPDSFAPEELESTLNALKGKLSSEAKHIEHVMSGIIRFQHYSNDLFSTSPFNFKRIFFGESTESFYQSLSSPYLDKNFDDQKKLKLLNQWIDEKIDSGVIVPKFERIGMDDGAIIWRRFFHAGLNRLTS